MAAKKSDKILVGKLEISTFAGFGVSAFPKWIAKGLPAKYEDSKWMAYATTIESFMEFYLKPVRGQAYVEEIGEHHDATR